jgi:cytochrome P450
LILNLVHSPPIEIIYFIQKQMIILYIILIIVIFYILIWYNEFRQQSKITNVKTGEKIKGPSSLFLFEYLFKGLFKKQGSINEEIHSKHPLLKKSKVYNGYMNFKIVVNVTTNELAKEVLTDIKTYEKTQPMTSKAFSKFLGFEHLVNVNGHQWKKQRKVLDPAFQNLEIYTKIFSEKTKLVLDKLKDREVESVHDFTQKLALDVLGESIFGHDFHSIDGSLQEDLEAYETMMNLLTPKKIFFQLFFQNLSFLEFNKNLEKCNKILDKLYVELIQESKKRIIENKGKSLSMLDMMVESTLSDTENALSDTEIRDNLSIFFLAGHET